MIDLLQKIIDKRLGTHNDIEEIKQHEYFSDINWNDVYERKLKPPKPQSDNFVVNYTKPRKIIQEDANNINDNNANNVKETKLHFKGWSFIQKETNSQPNN